MSGVTGAEEGEGGGSLTSPTTLSCHGLCCSVLCYAVFYSLLWCLVCCALVQNGDSAISRVPAPPYLTFDSTLLHCSLTHTPCFYPFNPQLAVLALSSQCRLVLPRCVIFTAPCVHIAGSRRSCHIRIFTPNSWVYYSSLEQPAGDNLSLGQTQTSVSSFSLCVFLLCCSRKLLFQGYFGFAQSSPRSTRVNSAQQITMFLLTPGSRSLVAKVVNVCWFGRNTCKPSAKSILSKVCILQCTELSRGHCDKVGMEFSCGQLAMFATSLLCWPDKHQFTGLGFNLQACQQLPGHVLSSAGSNMQYLC